MPVCIYSLSLCANIKNNSYCKNGAHQLFLTIQIFGHLNHDIRKVIDPVIQRNAQFSHSENLLVAMNTDECSYIGEVGFRRILRAIKRILVRVGVFQILVLWCTILHCLYLMEILWSHNSFNFRTCDNWRYQNTY